jgi:hypothetical protein
MWYCFISKLKRRNKGIMENLFKKNAFVFVSDHNSEPALVVLGIEPDGGIVAVREVVGVLNKSVMGEFVLDEKRIPQSLSGPWYVFSAEESVPRYRLYYGAEVVSVNS